MGRGFLICILLGALSISCEKDSNTCETPVISDNDTLGIIPVNALVISIDGIGQRIPLHGDVQDTLVLQEEGLRRFKIIGYEPENAAPPVIDSISFYRDLYSFNYKGDSIHIINSVLLEYDEEFIEKAEYIPVHNYSIHYAITDENDEYMGTISLKDINLDANNAEYAISLRRCAQGKGIGKSATIEILRIAFEEIGLEKVYLNVLSDNKRAIGMYEKIGFVYEGEFRKHLFLCGEYKSLRWYSILKDEYKRKYTM